ncbi:DUF4124 domain-containing protein [Oryzomonas sagensis]|uniref:DUF4124 domain-containing protein n=1 Tax=Oryzomonas sagensis TaxID=2603857 RepID=A0ABQ6TNS7_9BACT|nr:PLDc N-terminal domain-containing protein [Oryzomonas sagensis]KAB0670289.1 DUF4124 domain-containing protein [Oryzomonas sagensis]
MKKPIITFLAIFLLLPSFDNPAAYAEVYKWEDANGMHFTDNPSSVPDKYREKVYAETREQIKSTTPPVREGINQQNNPVAGQANQEAFYQAALEQQRRAAEAMHQQQDRALAASTRNLEKASRSLAGFMAIWLLIGLFLFIAWVSTLVDIVKSEFESPSNKTVWLLLVILLPLLGMIIYYCFGLGQKSDSSGFKDRQQEALRARLRPRDPKDRDFIIR